MLSSTEVPMETKYTEIKGVKSMLGPNPTQKTLDFKKSPYGVETHLQS
jgi:hypothetical protein